MKTFRATLFRNERQGAEKRAKVCTVYTFELRNACSVTPQKTTFATVKSHTATNHKRKGCAGPHEVRAKFGEAERAEAKRSPEQPGFSPAGRKVSQKQERSDTRTASTGSASRLRALRRRRSVRRPGYCEETTEEERKTGMATKNQEVIGQFAFWVGEAPNEQAQQQSQYAIQAAGNSFGSNAQARNIFIQTQAGAGFGELGTGSQRLSGPALGFYLQLGIFEDLINQDRARNGLIQSMQKNRNDMIREQGTNVAKTYVKSAVSAALPLITAFTGPVGAAAAVSVMYAMDSTEVDPNTGRVIIKSTDRAAIGAGVALAGALAGGSTAGFIASTALSTTAAAAQYDEKGRLTHFNFETGASGAALGRAVAGQIGGGAAGAIGGLAGVAAQTAVGLAAERAIEINLGRQFADYAGVATSALSGTIMEATGGNAALKASREADALTAEAARKNSNTQQAAGILQGFGAFMRKADDYVTGFLSGIGGAFGEGGFFEKAGNWWNDKGFVTNNDRRAAYAQQMGDAIGEDAREHAANLMRESGLFTEQQIDAYKAMSAMDNTQYDSTSASYQLRAARENKEGAYNTATGQRVYREAEAEIQAAIKEAGREGRNISMSEMAAIAQKHGISPAELFGEAATNRANALRGNDINRTELGQKIGMSLGQVTRNAQAAGMSVNDYVTAVQAERAKVAAAAATTTQPGERMFIKDTLLGRNGALGWLDKQLGTNMASAALTAYNHDNMVSNFTRDNDVAERIVVNKAKQVEQSLRNADWGRIGTNSLRIAGGALQTYGGILAIKGGAALSATGIGAIVGVPMIAAGGFMVVNGVGDMALGAIDIYRTFTDPESKQLRGNFAEGYKYMTGNEAAGWVDYADMGAGLVGSFSGIAGGIARVSTKAANLITRAGTGIVSGLRSGAAGLRAMGTQIANMARSSSEFVSKSVEGWKLVTEAAKVPEEVLHAFYRSAHTAQSAEVLKFLRNGEFKFLLDDISGSKLGGAVLDRMRIRDNIPIDEIQTIIAHEGQHLLDISRGLIPGKASELVGQPAKVLWAEFRAHLAGAKYAQLNNLTNTYHYELGNLSKRALIDKINDVYDLKVTLSDRLRIIRENSNFLGKYDPF